MADFCNVCAKEMGFDKFDINIEEIFESLELDQYQTCLCEGCGLKGIAKSEDGKLLVAGIKSKNSWVTKEQYFKERRY